MHTELATLRDELEATASEIKALAGQWEEQGNKAGEEEIKRYDDLEAKHDELKQQIATLERAEKARALTISKDAPSVIVKSRKNLITRSDTDKALRAYFTRNKDLFRNEYGEAAEKAGFNWRNDSITLRLRSQSELIQRQQSVGVDGEGGFSVNDTVVDGFERALDTYWNWSSMVSVRRTANGAPYAILTVDDTANEGAYTDELAAVANVDMTFARTQLDAYKISSGVFPVSNELLEDSSEDIATIVGFALGERIGRKLAREFTLGDGLTGHVRGYTLDSVLGYTSFYNDWIEYNDLVQLFFNLPEPYRASPSCAWQMHSLTLAHLVALEDTNGRPLFQAMSGGMNEGPRYTLLGKPVVINDLLDTTTSGLFTAGDTPVYFGDWSKYHVRIARDVSLRTSPDKYFLEDAIATIATMRVDGKLINAGADPIQHLKINDGTGATSHG